MIRATVGILAGAISVEPFTFEVDTTIAGSSGVGNFQLPLVNDGNTLNAQVLWGDGTSDTITTYNQAETLHTYPSGGTYTIEISGKISGWQFANGGDKLKMGDVSKWGALNISVSSGFRGCTNLTCSATDAPLITSTDLNLYFASCPNFNGAIGNWDVSNVTTMVAFMIFSTSFNQNIGSWDVRKVTSFYQFMYGATAFNNGNSNSISNWSINTTQPNINMREMFYFATAFNQDIGSWNISKVTNFNNFMAGKTSTNYSAANLDSIYNNWSQLSVPPNLSIHFGTIKYNASAQTNKDILTSSPNNWTITDGGQV